MILTISKYSELTGIPVKELEGKSRKHPIVIARFMYWYYLNEAEYLKCSSVEIGKIFDRSHVSILNGLKQIRNFTETNDSIITPYKEVIDPFLHI